MEIAAFVLQIEHPGAEALHIAPWGLHNYQDSGFTPSSLSCYLLIQTDWLKVSWHDYKSGVSPKDVAVQPEIYIWQDIYMTNAFRFEYFHTLINHWNFCTKKNFFRDLEYYEVNREKR